MHFFPGRFTLLVSLFYAYILFSGVYFWLRFLLFLWRFLIFITSVPSVGFGVGGGCRWGGLLGLGSFKFFF